MFDVEAARAKGATREDWPAAAGTYVLLFDVQHAIEISAGRLGIYTLETSGYAYVGSAWGPGGLAARLRRHAAGHKPLRWHIDYLTTLLPPSATLWCAGVAAECAWVARLLVLPGAGVPVPGFGSSDCQDGCPAHLLRLPDGLGLTDLEELLR